MTEESGSRLSFDKVEGDVRLPDYERGLNAAIEAYSIEDSAFTNDKDEVIKGAARLIGGYDADAEFADNAERNLFALAVSDAWLSTDSITEKKSLLDVLKLVSVARNEESNLATLSGRVRSLSESEDIRGTMFDPEATTANTHSEYIHMIREYVEDNKDAEASARIADLMNDWGETSKFRHVREKLGISTKEDEKPFGVVVLNKTARELKEDVGFIAFYMSISGKMTLVYNRDYHASDSLEHEYAHSQSDDLTSWYQSLLFRGINEALTEGSTSEPSNYPGQRDFLRRIFADNPDYENLFYRAYVEGGSARVEALSKMVEGYGLKGFLAIARLSPIDNPKLFGIVGQSIFIEPQEAWELLNEK